MQNGASSVAEKLSALSSSKRELFNRRRAALAAKARSAPASYAQQRLWFIDQLSPGNPAYNVPYAARLTGTLRIEALAWSFGEMVRRHEVLRTTFVSREGAPVQMIHPPAPFPVPVVDLRGLTGAARDTAAARLAAEEAARPFDLAAGPLLRVRLLRLGADDHVLLVTLHHIVSDGWSVAIVVRELTALYDACCHGLPSPLPDMPLQYADFAVWQREWMQGPVRDRQLTWWRDQLAALPTLDLTTDFPRPAAPTHRGDRVAIEIDDELARALRALSHDEGVTLFMTLLAAFQLVLARHTGQDDIVVGTDVANRNQEQIEPLIGFFVNQLVLRTDLGGQPTIRELLHRVRDVTLSAYAHQDLPFEQLVEELAPQNRSRSPLFQVKFLLQHAEDAAPRLADVALTPLADTRRSANFDLTLALVDSETALSGLVEYATDLFTREHVERLAGHVQSALRQFVADADLSVDTVQVLREDERAQAVVDWNPRPTPRPDACVHHLFEAQVERTPDAMAVESGETRWTFAELNARANRIAHYLRRLGVGPETHVAVFLDRGVQWMAGVLGILKAGAAYVPLDVAYPAARLDAMLADAAAPIVVTDSTWRDRLPAVWASIVSLDTDAELIARESDDNPPPLARPHHAAYVIYTSGTTGRPKGVVIEHRSVANLVAAQRDAFQVRPGSVVLQFASPGFDAAVSEWAVTLASGGCLVFASRDALMPGPDLVRTLRDRRVEIVTLPPSALRVLPDADLPSLRVLVAAGEACSTDIVRRWAGRVRLLNAYGPTEATVCAAIATLDEHDSRVPPIGPPMANAQAYVLDAAGHPIGAAMVGDLFIGGAGVGRGYLGQPRLTADRFVPAPFGSIPGARLYRTGDRARWRDDGQLEFLGRRDQQVKLRGHRIELEEIEAAIAQCPGVRQCAVVMREDDPSDVRLIAFVVGDADTSAVRAHVSRRLPDYMAPNTYARLDELPLTPNGKLDRRALSQVTGTVASDGRRYVPPATLEEEMVAGIWAGVLKVSSVGVEDNFFALGGHSLLATQVMARVHGAFGVEVPLRVLFETPTVRALAAAIEAARADRDAAGGMAPPALVPAPRTERLPLSSAQQRLWFLDQLTPGAATYHVPHALALTGPLPVRALAASVTALVARHEILRTTFPAHDGTPWQRIEPARPQRVPVIDLSALPPASAERAAQRLAAEEAARPFALATGPLLRTTLLRLGVESHVLLITLHHIVSDAWSVGILVRELAALYDAAVHGAAAPLPSPLPPLPLQYADVAAWQHAWLQGPVLDAHRAYWRQQLAHVPVLDLPTDAPRPALAPAQGARLPIEVSPEATAALRRLGQTEGVTLFMLVVAAFQVVLSRVSGQTDITVGTPIAQRPRAELEPLIGFFLNTLVLRTDLGDNPTWRTLLRRVRGTTLDAYAHQALPFEQLVEDLAPARDLSRTPLFQAMVAVQHAAPEPPRLTGLTVAPWGEAEATAKFDVTLLLTDDGASLAGALEYASALFTQETMARLGGQVVRALEALAADPDQHVGAAALLTPAERVQVLEAWNDTAREYPATLVHERIAAQAARTPDAVAVSDGERTWTYAELNARATQLAHVLRARYVGPETRVALWVERGLDLVACMLAVWKAGGAYVPLDPDHPADRLAYTLHDARARVVIASPGVTVPPDVAAVILRLDADREEIDAAPMTDPTSIGDPEHLAYVIYTSGSTGRPKGVMVTQGNLSNFLASMEETLGLTAADHLLAVTTSAFDIAGLELWLPLLVGARLVVASRDLVRDGAALARTARTESCTVLQATPAGWRALLAGGYDGGLRLALCGGERLDMHLADELVARQGAVWNLYGPTETTIWSTARRVTQAADARTIGQPIGNTQTYVVDESGAPVPIGVVGELWIGGAGVGRGYWNQPRQTAVRFVPDPFGRVPGGRVYRTGDRARWRADGQLEFLGRDDAQIKLRGYRIELGEIEAVIAQCPGVTQCVALIHGDAPVHTPHPSPLPASGARESLARLVAYVAGPVVDLAAVRAHVQRSLPDYMQPSAYVPLPWIPLTPNGKVDRRALPVPDAAPAGDTYIAPRTATEEIVAGIWASLLARDRVGVDDHFFALGGHSLIATQAISRVRGALGIEIPLRTLFEKPTPRTFADAIESFRGETGATGAAAPPLTRVDRSGPLPLSFAQQRLWFLHQLDPAASAYNVPYALRFNGALDVDALAHALASVVRRHEILRTTFDTLDGVAVQRIHNSAASAPHLPVVDLRALPAVARDAAASALALAEAQRPFDLRTGPLLRSTLLRLDEQSYVFLLTLHHIVSDGWSVEIFVRETTALYEAHRQGASSPLPDVALQYADFAAWQRQWLRGDVLDRQLGYWRQQLASLPTLDLPTDLPRPSTETHNGATVPIAIGPELTTALKALSRDEGVTLFMTLVAAFQLVLSRYSGQDDITIGTDIANRNHEAVEPLIGFFINQLVLRTDLSGEPSVRELLRRVRQVCLSAYAHQDLPFEQLVEEVAPQRDQSRPPLFQVKLLLQHAPDRALRFSDVMLENFGDTYQSAKFDLTLVLTEAGSTLTGHLEYATDLFMRPTMARLVGHVQRALERMVDAPDAPIASVELLTEAERFQLTRSWQGDETAAPTVSLSTLFEAQAARQPAAIAVTDGTRRWTYAELNARANQVAHVLREVGVGAETMVGVCLERGLDAVASLLGVLKAGGVYLPLDPSYPAARLAFMLNDAQAPVVLTTTAGQGRLPTGWATVIAIDAEASRLSAAPTTNGPPIGASAQGAYAIYTSGSTGQPKGVVISQTSLVHLAAAQQAVLSVVQTDVVLQFASPSFDAAIWEVLLALATGARLVVATGAAGLPGPALASLLAGEGVTVATLPPSMVTSWDVGAAAPDLRLLILAGEACPAGLATRWAPRVRVINAYGPSEATVCATLGPVTVGPGTVGPGTVESGTVESGPPPIGRPLPRTQVLVLDDAGAPVPAGVVGEVWIGGAGVGRGYWQRPRLTAARFVPDPFGDRPGARLYGTGDRGRWRLFSGGGEGGQLEFVGRRDAQVKLRGYRIELGEIETALTQAPGVEQGVAIVRDAGTPGAQLVAYWTGKADAETLRAHLARQVPAYMVPTAWVPLETWPRTATGKLDRAALPPPPSATPAPLDPGRTPVEEIVAGVFADLLRRPHIGVTDNFFTLGGHSLLATQVLSRLRAAFDVELPLRTLFEQPTVRAVAAAIEQQRRGDLPAPPAARARGAAPPLSYAQQRLWFLHQLDPQGSAYNVPHAVRLDGVLDVRALSLSLREIVRRHDVLRATFPSEGGQPVQHIHPPAPPPLPVVDLRGLPPTLSSKVINRLATAEASRPFDLGVGPLLRACLLRIDGSAIDGGAHVLLLTMHHIVCDGWSLGIFVRELTTLYEAYARGSASPLPEMSLQYADFAAWQRDWLRGEHLDRQLAYWRRHLAGLAPLALATDFPRPAMASERGAWAPVAIGADVAAGLRRVSQAENATLFMTILAAFQVVLGRHAGQTDIAVGTPIANRTYRELEPLIGFFVNTLVLRTDLGGNPTFRALLRRVRDVTLSAYAHQDVPFEQLVDELAPERDLSRSPLFQAMLSMTTAAPDSPALAGIDLTAMGQTTTTAKFDLSLILGEHDRGIEGVLEYATDTFAAETMNRLAGHLQHVLAQVAAQPDIRLGDVRIMDDAERRQVLDEWNSTAHAYPPGLVHEVIEAQAARHPEWLAVSDGATSRTYAELNMRANQIARHLRARGVGVETRVALHVERGYDLIACVLGVLKAGAAFVPLDPAYPADRLTYMLDDSRASLLIAGETGTQTLPATVPVLSLAADRHAITRRGRGNPPPIAIPSNLAYVVYTSGSTGLPKAVLIPHAGLLNHVRTKIDDLAIVSADSVAQTASSSFDIAIWQMLAPLMTGAAVQVFDDSTVRDGELLVEAIDRSAVTIVETVPVLLDAMLERASSSRDPLSLSHLRVMISNADTLPRALADRWCARFPAVTLINTYGASECSDDVTHHHVAAGGAQEADGAVPLGRPLANSRVYVLDADGQPVPIGVRGELCIGGMGVGRGYGNRPRLTAERFVPDPYASEPGARYYRTGDSGRWRADGQLEFLGRTDQQVKIRGHRVEIGEIEAVIQQEAGVRQCAVIVREDAPGDVKLVAYVVGDADATEVRARVQRQLPDYMSPNAYVTVDHLPLTPNGKLDRSALPAPAFETGQLYVPPRTAAEEMVAGIWSSVLGGTRVGLDDNFFALGGHSLLATQVISRVRRAFGVDLAVRVLFERPTVRGLTAAIQLARHEGADLPPPVRRAAREGVLPTSHAQRRLWFIDQLNPGQSTYNVPYALRLDGALHADALMRAVSEIARRHETLRTTFPSVEGTPAPHVAEPALVPLPIVDLSGLPDASRDRAAEALAAAEAQQPFDLAAGPLLRMRLLRLGPRSHTFLLTLHHIVSDGWSVGIIARELAALYDAFARGEASPLPELPLQYRDFAAWQRDWLTGDVLARQQAYWQRQLAGSSTLDLPTDFPRPAMSSHRGATVPIVIGPALTSQLRQLSQAEGVTMFMTLLAAFQLVLGRYAGQKDVAIGTPIANRTREETEGLIGFFVNTLVLRTSLEGDPTLRDLLHRVRDTTLAAYAHQDLPFEQLVDALAPERDSSRPPLFQVMMALLHAQPAATPFAGLGVTPLDTAGTTAKFDITLALSDDGQAIDGVLEYATDLFTPATLEYIARYFHRVLGQMAADPAMRVGDVRLMDDAERSRVLSEWNDTACDYPPALFPEAIESRAARMPEAPAVGDGVDTWSYGTLTARANQLAHYLRALGVGVETRVAVCVERRPVLIGCLLGVWKAGGAYVPFDPGAPPERLAALVADVKPRVIIVDSVSPVPPCDGVHVVCLDVDMPAIGLQPRQAPAVAIGHDQLAYIYYTSGSTGRPKGVMISHGSLMNYIRWAADAYGATSSAHVPVHSNFSFDLGLTNVWPPLLAGASLRMAPAIEDKAVMQAKTPWTLIKVTPAHLSIMREAAMDTDPNSLTRTLVIGGEALTCENLAWWHTHAPGTRLLNEYGPTETVVGCCIYDASGMDPASAGPVPIGRAIANMQTYVVDANDAPTPVGVVGELWIGGVGVGRGYWTDPRQTAARFVPDPFGGVPGARVYRTGDRARWRTDGELEFLGRDDEQVKLRGYRIELGEIEAAIGACAGVAQCVVAMREDQPGLAMLVAYVAGSADLAVVRAHVQRRLPAYMHPAAYVALPRIPLAASGKVDRRALPAPVMASETDAAPRTLTEEILAGIWTSLLGVERVGLDDDFFARGGHSLLATRMTARARRAFGVELPLSLVFTQPTIRALAQAIDGAHHDAPPLTLEAAPREGALPLSHAQQRLWFDAQLAPDSAAYHVPYAVRLTGTIDAAALAWSLGEVVRRHEVLRTSFPVLDGVPIQQIHAPDTVPLPIVDLDALASARRGDAEARLVSAEARRPFDLSTGPLLRAVLLRLDAQRSTFVLTMHHIASDGWSIEILMRELTALYDARVRGAALALPPLPLQYADFAASQRGWLEGGVLERDLAYWCEQLAGVAARELPSDFQPAAGATHRSASVPVEIEPASASALTQVCREEGVTRFMLLLTAFQAVLTRHAGAEDVVVGTTIANRTHEELEGLIGFFVNTLVLRTSFAGRPTFREQLHRVRETVLAAYAHQHAPFDRVVEALAPDRERDHSLFQAKFVFDAVNADAGRGVAISGVDLEAVDIIVEEAKFPLLLQLREVDGRIAGALTYDTALYSTATANGLARMFADLLARAAATSDREACVLSELVADVEREYLAHTHDRYSTVASNLKSSTRRRAGAAS